MLGRLICRLSSTWSSCPPAITCSAPGALLSQAFLPTLFPSFFFFPPSHHAPNASHRPVLSRFAWHTDGAARQALGHTLQPFSPSNNTVPLSRAQHSPRVHLLLSDSRPSASQRTRAAPRSFPSGRARSLRLPAPVSRTLKQACWRARLSTPLGPSLLNSEPRHHHHAARDPP